MNFSSMAMFEEASVKLLTSKDWQARTKKLEGWSSLARPAINSCSRSESSADRVLSGTKSAPRRVCHSALSACMDENAHADQTMIEDTTPKLPRATNRMVMVSAPFR